MSMSRINNDLKPTPQSSSSASNPVGGVQGKTKSPREPGDYAVNVSQRAQDLVQAKKTAHTIAKSTPDINNDRVMELKQRIQQGEYRIQPEKIADGILNEAVKDELARRIIKEN